VIAPDAKYCIPLGNLDAAEAAPLACSGVTTYSALRKFGASIRDEPVVIVGAGGMGMMAMQIVKALGGRGSIIVDIDPAKREAAAKAGALATVDGRAPNAAQQLIEATGGGVKRVLGTGRFAGHGQSGDRGRRARCRDRDRRPVWRRDDDPGAHLPVEAPGDPRQLRGQPGRSSMNWSASARSGGLSLVPVNRRGQDEANSALCRSEGRQDHRAGGAGALTRQASGKRRASQRASAALTSTGFSWAIQ
jgi:hypothetical protein